MNTAKGMARAEQLAKRPKKQRGGQVAVRPDFESAAPDALAWWRPAWKGWPPATSRPAPCTPGATR